MTSRKVPSSMYEFEITRANSKTEPRDGIYTRAMLNPPTFELS